MRRSAHIYQRLWLLLLLGMQLLLLLVVVLMLLLGPCFLFLFSCLFVVNKYSFMKGWGNG